MKQVWRPEPESNRRARICSPLRNHSAIGPRQLCAGCVWKAALCGEGRAKSRRHRVLKRQGATVTQASRAETSRSDRYAGIAFGADLAAQPLRCCARSKRADLQPRD